MMRSLEFIGAGGDLQCVSGTNAVSGNFRSIANFALSTKDAIGDALRLDPAIRSGTANSADPLQKAFNPSSWLKLDTLIGTPLIVPSSRVLEAQKAYIMGLKEGWDGEGAPPISGKLIEQFFEEIREVAAALGGIVDVVPGADGSLQAEWRRIDADIFYTAEASGERSLMIDFGDGNEFAGAGLATIHVLRCYALQPAGGLNGGLSQRAA